MSPPPKDTAHLSSNPQIVLRVHAICPGAIADHCLATVAIPDNWPNMFKIERSIAKTASLSPEIVAISSPLMTLRPSPALQEMLSPPAQICSIWSTAAQPTKMPSSCTQMLA